MLPVCAREKKGVTLISKGKKVLTIWLIVHLVDYGEKAGTISYCYYDCRCDFKLNHVSTYQFF